MVSGNTTLLFIILENCIGLMVIAGLKEGPDSDLQKDGALKA